MATATGKARPVVAPKSADHGHSVAHGSVLLDFQNGGRAMVCLLTVTSIVGQPSMSVSTSLPLAPTSTVSSDRAGDRRVPGIDLAGRYDLRHAGRGDDLARFVGRRGRPGGDIATDRRSRRRRRQPGHRQRCHQRAARPRAEDEGAVDLGTTCSFAPQFVGQLAKADEARDGADQPILSPAKHEHGIAIELVCRGIGWHGTGRYARRWR